MHDRFVQLLAERYSAAKSQYPNESRREWHLRVLQEFWSVGPHHQAGTVNSTRTHSPEEFMQDDDALDSILEGQELGLLLRTDYSNDGAWQAFCVKLEDSEKEFSESIKSNEGEQEERDASKQDNSASNPDVTDDASDSDMSTDGIPFPLIKIIDPTLVEQKAIFTNASNLTALRLLNDVDIRLSPPPHAKRIDPQNRLIDQRGWQEIYSGLTIWIYDALSNTDQSVRLVNQKGDIYGTATGDSWRAKVTHICELQFQMSFLSMKIDFGGLDRWDHSERRRNLDEANIIP